MLRDGVRTVDEPQSGGCCQRRPAYRRIGRDVLSCWPCSILGSDSQAASTSELAVQVRRARQPEQGEASSRGIYQALPFQEDESFCSLRRTVPSHASEFRGVDAACVSR